MKDYKGQRLYIALGPSQVRRRLKGHGFGVKTVQSVGRNLAVIVHTATGDHLRQLKQLFADVRVAESEAQLSDPHWQSVNQPVEHDRQQTQDQ